MPACRERQNGFPASLAEAGYLFIPISSYKPICRYLIRIFQSGLLPVSGRSRNKPDFWGISC
jgi:hypothetical protein